MTALCGSDNKYNNNLLSKRECKFNDKNDCKTMLSKVKEYTDMNTTLLLFASILRAQLINICLHNFTFIMIIPCIAD